MKAENLNTATCRESRFGVFVSQVELVENYPGTALPPALHTGGADAGRRMRACHAGMIDGKLFVR